jgi:hypothetical protein
LGTISGEEEMSLKINGLCLINSNIVTAFSDKAIGTKVLDGNRFCERLADAIVKNKDAFVFGKTSGQAVIEIVGPDYSFVSGGMGRKSKRPEDYVIREYRGQAQMFLKRHLAEPIKSLRAVVYTKEAYLNDPDTKADPEEFDRIAKTDATHVLVAILAETVESTVSPYRFVCNLAGGNLDYAEGKMTFSELVELAKKVKAFSEEWRIVAD